MPEIHFVLRARLDEQKLDEWVRRLYQPELDDPAPGEPQPGRQYALDMIEEGRGAIKAGEVIDSTWLDASQEFVIDLSLDLGPALVFRTEQERATVRAALKRLLRAPDMASGSAALVPSLLAQLGEDS